MAWYSAGTISVTNGQTAVTGTGTQFLANRVSAGCGIIIGGQTYEIVSVASDTVLAIAPAYLGTTNASAPYRVFPTEQRAGDMLSAVTDLTSAISGVNSAFSSQPTSITSAKKIILPASTTTIASISLPHGTAPSSPTDGDIWTTTEGLFVRANGTTQQPLTSSGGSISGSLTLSGSLSADSASVSGTLSGNIGSFSGNLDTSGNFAAGSVITTGTGVATGDAVIEIGGNRTGSGLATLDFHARSGSDYDARIQRGAGANGAFSISQLGSGSLNIAQDGSGEIGIWTSGAQRMSFLSNGMIRTNGNTIFSGSSASSVVLAAGTDVATGGATIIARGSTAASNAGGIEFYSGVGSTSSQNVTIKANGFVGIGSSNPTAKLDITGLASGAEVEARIVNSSTSNNSTARITLSTSTSNAYCIWAVNNGAANPYRAISNGSAVTVAYDDSNHHSWRTTAGSEKMYLNSSSTLVVNGGVNSSNGMFVAANAMIQGAGGHMYVRPTNAGSNLYLGSNNTNYMCIYSGGAVGIGSNDPNRKLHVESEDCWVKYKRTSGRSWLIGPGTQDPLLFYDETAGIARLVIQTDGHVRAGNDNVQSLGVSGARWTTVYAVSGAVSTSDETYKVFDDAGFSPAELAAAREIAATIRKYQWKDSIEEKGEEGARYHVGVGAQTVWNIMATHGLIDELEEGVKPDSRYGFLCWDEWEAAETKSGDDVIASTEAGSRFSVRYDELNQFLIAAQEQRLAILEHALGG
ncbi:MULTISPECIES: tail fiber domain-containing protein [unclassified Sphingobium]|uniref:tail fiber domain-containing protein n=1 Tax=unclassified Sphingobium TaxID=2611147 RepID=UPI00222483B6|nr:MULTISPECIES: tail fiber domain-containing protein [unclassified Sphingobium]MCW2412945.1 hypothetical protein [Sphingobium sp. B8D3D]MCW2414757.1 hypothetical protein [Sphingobium sp. B8D3A]